MIVIGLTIAVMLGFIGYLHLQVSPNIAHDLYPIKKPLFLMSYIWLAYCLAITAFNIWVGNWFWI